MLKLAFGGSLSSQFEFAQRLQHPEALRLVETILHDPQTTVELEPLYVQIAR